MPLALPPIGPRSLAVACARQGSEAYDAGTPLTGCPYGPDRPYSRRSWVEGFAAAARRAGVTPLEEDVDESAPWPGDTP